MRYIFSKIQIKKSILVLLILQLGLYLGASAQNKYAVEGILTDSSTHKKTTNAVVMLLSPDSSLKKWTRVNGNGSFKIQISDTGKYTIVITHPSFADYTDDINIEQKDIKLDSIYMLPKEQALQAFIFKAYKGAVKFKGDTVEYMADSFKVKENANVEDLLKKLPGFTVKKDGSINALGKGVDIILVDGEEFFSEDPTMVTKNLNANSVDKVQVYDKKSDQAEATGIDDGERTRTLNLKLKEEGKKGYFGNVKLGYGPVNWYENQAMINLFKRKRKFSTYIVHSNTNKKDLNWDEQRNFGTTDDRNSTVYGDDGSVTYYSYSDNDGLDGGQGLPTTINGGAHFSDTWKNDSHHVVTNFSTNHIERKGVTSGNSQQILEDRILKNATSGSLNTNGTKYSYIILYEFKPDSFNYYKIYFQTTFSRNKKDYKYTIFRSDQNDSALSGNDRFNTTDDKNLYYQGKFEYRRKFRKKGRLVNIQGEYNQREVNSDGTLLSLNNYYSKNQIYKTDTINQLREVSSLVGNTSILGSYSEPLTKKLILMVSYKFSRNDNHNYTNSFDQEYGQQKTLNPFYSNDYQFATQSQTPGINLTYINKKLTLRAGGSIINNYFYQKNLVNDSAFDYTFNNFQRSGGIIYKFSSQRTINLNYNGTVQQPSITQIQPLRNNTDPFNIQIGNPNLKASLNNQIQLFYNDYSVIKSRYIYLGIFGNLTDRAFTSRDTIDGAGRRISQTVNVNGNRNFSFWSNYHKEISKKWSFSTGLNLQNNVYNNYVNGLANQTNSYNISISPTISFEKEDTFEISFRINPEFNYSKSSLTNIYTQYWYYNYYVDATVYLPGEIEIGTDCNFNFRQRTNAFSTNTNMIIWNAYAERAMLKDKKSILKIGVYDILNQNIGFNRNIQSNYISEQRYQTIKRYFLVSFKYVFNKQGAKKVETK